MWTTHVPRRAVSWRERRQVLGTTAVLRLTGRAGQVEREAYLGALAAALVAGKCSLEQAVAELLELSEPWMRGLVAARLRRLPARADPQVTEHWLWMEWHGALSRFDPARVETFPAYVALRLRMALALAAREDDPLPRKARARLQAMEQAEASLVQHLGRPLSTAEEGQLADSILGPWRPLIEARLSLVELPAEDLVSPEPDPAVAVERSSLRRAVRAAVVIPVDRRSDRLRLWLEDAEHHDREPSQRVVNVPPAVRAALAAWARDAPDGGCGDSAA